MSTTEIVIARHGEVLNVPESLSTESARGLTGPGVAQARLLAQYLAEDAERDGGFAALYISPRIACLQTAEPVADALGVKAKAVQELRPVEGDPEPLHVGHESADALHKPGAHASGTRRAVLDRSGAFLVSLAVAHAGRRILVVGHQETADAAMIAFLRLPLGSTWWRAPLGHGALSRWSRQVEQHAPQAVWSLTAHNDTGHLRARDTSYLRARTVPESWVPRPVREAEATP